MDPGGWTSKKWAPRLLPRSACKCHEACAFEAASPVSRTGTAGHTAGHSQSQLGTAWHSLALGTGRRRASRCPAGSLPPRAGALASCPFFFWTSVSPCFCSSECTEIGESIFLQLDLSALSFIGVLSALTSSFFWSTWPWPASPQGFLSFQLTWPPAVKLPAVKDHLCSFWSLQRPAGQLE